jgi:hypothetical protein
MPLVGAGAVQPMSEGKWSQFATIKASDTLAERNKLDASGRQPSPILRRIRQ